MSKNYRHIPYDVAHKKITGNEYLIDYLYKKVSLEELLNLFSENTTTNSKVYYYGTQYSFKNRFNKDNSLYVDNFSDFEIIDSVNIYPRKDFNKVEKVTLDTSPTSGFPYEFKYDKKKIKYSIKSINQHNVYLKTGNIDHAYVDIENKGSLLNILDLLNVPRVDDNHNEIVKISELFANRLTPVYNPKDDHYYFYDIAEDKKDTYDFFDFLDSRKNNFKKKEYDPNNYKIIIVKTLSNVFTINRRVYDDNIPSYDFIKILPLISGKHAINKKLPYGKTPFKELRRKEKNCFNHHVKSINSGADYDDIDFDYIKHSDYY